jgi:hypothetical protein
MDTRSLPLDSHTEAGAGTSQLRLLRGTRFSAVCRAAGAIHALAWLAGAVAGSDPAELSAYVGMTTSTTAHSTGKQSLAARSSRAHRYGLSDFQGTASI